MKKPIRVLVAKPGLDGHDRGALVISQALRDYGMEVIYTGLRQTPEQIVAAAIQEDVDVIGLSCLSGAHNELFPEVVSLLKEENAEDIVVVGGGVIPWEDIPFLESAGIKKIFTSGTATIEIAKFIEQTVNQRDGLPTPSCFESHQIDHLGIAVHSIEAALPFYTDHLHFQLETTEIVASEGVKVAFLRSGEIHLELLEAITEKSPISKFIEKHGEGIHHIALAVKGIQDRINQLKAQGIQMLQDTPKEGARGAQIAFIHPKSASGVLYELCERKGGETDGHLSKDQ